MSPLPFDDREFTARADLTDRVRRFMRDDSRINRGVTGQEHSDTDIQAAIDYALMEFNSMPPIIGYYSIQNFPDVSLLLDGITAALLESALILYARNATEVVHSGTRVVRNQVNLYPRLAEMYRQRFGQKARMWKVARNIAETFDASGGIHSSFIYTYRPLGAVRHLGSFRK